MAEIRKTKAIRKKAQTIQTLGVIRDSMDGEAREDAPSVRAVKEYINTNVIEYFNGIIAALKGEVFLKKDPIPAQNIKVQLTGVYHDSYIAALDGSKIIVNADGTKSILLSDLLLNYPVGW